MMIPFCWQPSLFRRAILLELWARERFAPIPPAALWPGRLDPHHHHHKSSHFITATPAAAARARHLSFSLSPTQPALHPQHKKRWRLMHGPRGKKEHFQLELGGEASESRAAQSGSLGDDGSRWHSQTSSESLTQADPPLIPLSFTVVTLHQAMWFPLCSSGPPSTGVLKTKATECARAILLSCL